MSEHQMTTGQHKVRFQLFDPTSKPEGSRTLWSFPALVGEKKRSATISVPKSVEMSPDELVELAARAIQDELREEVFLSCRHTWNAEHKCQRCDIWRVFVDPSGDWA